MAKKVIDISNHNGTINFAAVKAAGIFGVIIRAGATGYGAGHTKFKDERFDENYAGAKAAGLEVGAYYYSCAMSVAEAEDEAKYFLELLKGKQFELPVYMDVEETNAPSDMRTLGKTILTQIVTKFCSTVEAAGYFVGFYTGKYWLRDYLNEKELRRFTLWLAHWTNKTDYTGDYGMWQYSATGKVPGVNGSVDMDYQYIDYSPLIKGSGLNGFAEQKKEKHYILIEGEMTEAEAATIIMMYADKYKAAEYVLGDMDGDGKVTAADARIIQRKMVGLE